MDFEQKAFQFIAKNKLVRPGLLIVGVSGGADSMALLCCLAGLRHDLGIELHAAHFNHKIRPQAGRDERFVAEWCRRFNVPLTIGDRMGGRIKHLSEDDARQMRFEFFVKTAAHLKAQAVALAHTRSDLAETVLMRLLRGSGLYGLRGILPRRTIKGVVFVRPFLSASRTDIEGYLKFKKVPFCTDATNQQPVYSRNKLRLKLLPLLAQEYNPRIVGALSDLACTAGEDYEFLAAHARKKFEKNVIVSGGKVKIALNRIRLEPPAIRRLILRQMAETLTHDPAVFNFEHIRALEDLITGDGRGPVHLPCLLSAAKTVKFLELSGVRPKGNPCFNF